MGTDPEAPRRPEPPPDRGVDRDADQPNVDEPDVDEPDVDEPGGAQYVDQPDADQEASRPESPPSVGPERRRPEPPHYPPPSSANWPGWMPPGTSVPPGLPGPPSRYPTNRRRSPAGCLLTAALFVIVVVALIWVVTHRQ